MKRKFKVGDKVKRISQTPIHGDNPARKYHKEVKIGEIVKIEYVSERGNLCFEGMKWFANGQDFVLFTPNTKRAILRKSVDGTFYYTLHNGNPKNIGTNRGINRKQDALDTLANSFPDFEVVDETKKK